MTYDEMIAVLQAAKVGKTIQRREKYSNDEWEDAQPFWNFVSFDYRAKPDTKLRPYANAEEFLADMKEHGPYFKRDDSPTYWLPSLVKDNGIEISIYNNTFQAEDGWAYMFKEMVEYTWQDGHPCGIEK